MLKKHDALHNLVLFVQFKRGVLLLIKMKVTPIHGYFSGFINCTNGTIWFKAS